MAHRIKRGDTGNALVVQLLRGDVPVDLTDTDVTFTMVTEADGSVVATGPVAVADGTDGWVTYLWQPSDLAETGLFLAEFQVTFPDTTVLTFPTDGAIALEIVPDLDGTLPEDEAVTGVCWPVDVSCCEAFGDYPIDVQDRAKRLAGQTMHMLTGSRVGGCPVTIRPCRERACGSMTWAMTDGGLMPLNWNGTWYNCGCGGSRCARMSARALKMPPQVGSVVGVRLNGEDLVASADYRFDGTYLVRTDGEWPLTQDLDEPDTEVDTFSVTYIPGVAVDAQGQWLAGLLACEYAKACTTGKCSLPASVTSVVRRGVTFEMSPGAFPGGVTGIREVDAYLAYWNPHAKKRPSTVFSPDVRVY